MTLECETRRPAKRVTWLKGMVELRSGRKYVIRQKGVVLSLTVNSLEKSDTDIYICDVGTMQSRAQLTVQGETIVKGMLGTACTECGFRVIGLNSTGEKNGRWTNLNPYCLFSCRRNSDTFYSLKGPRYLTNIWQVCVIMLRFYYYGV